MKEERKNLVKRVAATAAVAGSLAIGGMVTAGAAGADTISKSSSSVLTNVTPGFSEPITLSNDGCCIRPVVNNRSCC